jgi:membrane-associated phospholipid phosphatase
MKHLGYAWTILQHRVTPLVTTLGVAVLGACLAILFGLSWLCSEVLEKEALQFDRTLLLWIHQGANPVLDSLMLIITRLGNPETVVGIVAGSMAWLWSKRRYAEMKSFAIACIGTLILNQGMKLFFAKPRPELWTRLIAEHSFSFPSGHALGSFVLYGFLAYLLATQFPGFARIIYGIAVGVIGGIGFSRLYLGVHWPTDVLAGYGVGFLWLTACIAMIKIQTLQQQLGQDESISDQ